MIYDVYTRCCSGKEVWWNGDRSEVYQAWYGGVPGWVKLESTVEGCHDIGLGEGGALDIVLGEESVQCAQL